MSPPSSNDALIRERIVFFVGDSGTIGFRGVGNKTVDVGSILQRFHQLGLALNREPIEKLQTIRNNIEHYDAMDTSEQMQEAIAATFHVVRDVIVNHLGGDPATLLGAATWGRMLAETEMYDEHLKRCLRSIDALQGVPEPSKVLLENLTCPRCDSELVEALDSDYGIDTRFSCRACGAKLTTYDVIKRHLDEEYRGAWYEAGMGNGSDPIEECVDCALDTFDTEHQVCLICGGRSSSEDYGYDDEGPDPTA